MLAVVEIGKKQYIVQEDDTLKVQKLKDQEGKVIFDKVLVLSNDKKIDIGAPYLENVTVEAEIEGEFKDKKVIIYKYKRRKKYRKKQGHRQTYTTLKITRIAASSSQNSPK